MRYAFPVLDGSYEVRLFMGNGFSGTSEVGQRVFSAAVEGAVPAAFATIDLVDRFGHQVGGMLTTQVDVSDGELNIDFLHQVQNPLVNGIEIRHVESSSSPGVVQIGTDDDDRLVGGAGDDWLVGLSGNDVLNGGGGDDIMIGGTGNDIYVVDSPDDKVIELPCKGIDLVRSSIAYTLQANVERLALAGRIPINGAGNRLNNRLFGNTAGNRLEGFGGNDVLIGRGGRDIMAGGPDGDILTGGPGKDTFRYGSLTDSLLPGSKRDRIRDLKIGADIIDGPNSLKAADVVQAGEAARLNRRAVAAVLTAGIFSTDGAATFTLGSRTFLALNDRRPGFQSATDTIIDITGVSGNLDNLSIL
jgi:Ca2+-binding RTX toxin-like protein